jgi:hypothetical protein
MNEELNVRLSELRAAADAMQYGAAAIRSAVEGVRDQVAALAAHVDPQASPGFGALVYSDRLVELTDTIDRLSRQLRRAADDVDSASRWRGPPLGILWDRLKDGPPLRAASAEPSGQPAAYTLGRYISRANRPMYDALLADRAALDDERVQIATLTAARAAAREEAAALHDRLRAYGETDIAAVPRVRVLGEQIAEFDRQIGDAEARSERLQTRIDAATARLLEVNPAEQADVHVIRGLEGGESAPYVLANTRDCVNYIASRVSIPGELAANAHLWDQRAADYPQFGIRAGDEPKVGSILVMEADHPYADDRYGHVMLVERVDSSGSVWVTDNNHAEPVRLTDLTDETTGPRVKYLYLPWFTKA